MEHLLRLSGLLGIDEEGQTDLGVLEKRLAQRASEHGSPASDHNRVRTSSQPHVSSGPHSPSSRSSSTAPKTTLEKELEQGNTKPDGGVNDLADLMDSLVTNNQGETRYIGT